MLWISVAVTIPGFFPWWLQGGFWGFALGSGVFGGAYTLHMVFMRDRIARKDEDFKRLEAKITELEKQPQNQPIHQVSPPQSQIEPVSIVEVSETNKKAPKLLSPEPSSHSPLNQTELKIQALQTANKIYIAIENAKRQARQTISGSDVVADFLYREVRSGDSNDERYRKIVNSVLDYYSNNLHETAVTLKLKIFAPNGSKSLARSDYTSPAGLHALEAIANDLKEIANTKDE
jgi:hypothetical protein